MSATLRLSAVLGVLLCTLGLVRADELRIEALDGGVVDLSGLTQIVVQQKSIHIVADGANSTVDLAGLTSFAAPPDAPASTVSADNNGAITLNSTKTTLNGPVQLELTATGTVTLGALELGANALLTGSGTLSGGLINGGEVSPGGTGAAGGIHVSGPYTQTNQGKLKIELGGTIPGSQYDRLTGTAAASLNGALNISLIHNYRPDAGRRFDFLTANSRSGQFSSTSGLDLGGGARLNLEYAATGAALIASGTGLPDDEGPEISDVRFEGLTLTDSFSITQSGTITLTADDPSGIDRVEFLLDGDRFATDARGINPASALLSTAGIADGSYELTIIAYDTLNNATRLTYSVLIGTSVSDVPDLVVTALQVPAEHLPGQSANVTWTVRNRGNMTAHGPWADKLYISPDNIFGNGNDTLLTSAPFPAGSSLAPGAAYERAFSITLPNAPGNYWLIVVTDADNQVAEEGGEFNNVLISETPLVVQSELPDLVVTEVIPPANGVLSGSTTEITFVVKNVGVRATEVNWKDLIILSPDTALIDPPPFLFNEDIRDQFDNPQFLLPGESYQQTVSITLPEDKIGAFYIAVYADARPRGPKGGPFQVPEQNESNNITFSDSFTIALAPQPDLVVADIDASPKPVFSGQELTVTRTDRNQGEGPTDSGTWTDAVYLSANNQPTIDTAQDIWLGTQTRRGAILQPGQADTGLLLKERLPANLQGNFYVKVVADLNNQITELGAEDNNVGVSAQPIQVVLSVPVDLEATDIHGPQTGIPGHAIEVTWSAENVGAEPEFFLFWKDTIYLSSDQVLDGSDVQLGTFAAVTSTVNGQLTVLPYTHTRSVRLPNGTAAGTYYLIVKIDAEDEVFELTTGEQNNVLASAVPIIIELMPTDLTVEVNFDAAHQLPTAIAAGQSLPLSWRVTNTGQAATPVFSWQDQVYLSGDATLDGEDRLLATFTHGGGLAPGASYIVTQNTTMPLVGPGNYFLLVKTDYTNLVYEQPPGEDNNLVSSPLTVSGDAPDLTAADCVAPDSLASGSPLHVEWTVNNGGTLPTSASSWVDTVYLSIDQSLDDNDTELGSRFSPPGGLAAGDSYTQAADFDVPLQLSGLFYLIQQTDRANTVFEINENNNLCIRPILINLDPNKLSNLTVSAFSAPNTALAGQPISVTWTVTNTGIGPTNVTHWNDGVYLSLDQFFDPGQDLFIGSAFIDQPLSGGASYTRTADFNVPAGIAGTYYVFMATDTNDQVVETDEGDNVGGPEAIQVIPPPPSDLMVGEITPPAHGILGQEAIFSWKITNAGDQPVSGGWRDSVYLSSDPQWDINDKRVGTFARLPGPLNPGESITLTGTGTIPAVLPGTYYVIVRTDVFNQIPESNEANNLGASAGTFEVSAIPLALGTPFEGSLVNGQEQYFQFDVAAGETVRITLDHTSPTAWTELYVRYGAVPTPGQFDFLFDAPAQPDQEITIPTTQAGRYYVLAKATTRVLEPSFGFSLLAETVPFGITSVEPSVVGTGQVTLRVRGTRWQNPVVFKLRHPSSGKTVEARSAEVRDATFARVTFNLTNAELGLYDLIVTDSSTNAETSLAEALTVEPATPLAIQHRAEGFTATRKGTEGSGIAIFRNVSNVDIPFAKLTVGSGYAEGLKLIMPDDGRRLQARRITEELRLADFFVAPLAVGDESIIPLIIKPASSYAWPDAFVFTNPKAYSIEEYAEQFERPIVKEMLLRGSIETGIVLTDAEMQSAEDEIVRQLIEHHRQFGILPDLNNGLNRSIPTAIDIITPQSLSTCDYICAGGGGAASLLCTLKPLHPVAIVLLAAGCSVISSTVCELICNHNPDDEDDGDGTDDEPPHPPEEDDSDEFICPRESSCSVNPKCPEPIEIKDPDGCVVQIEYWWLKAKGACYHPLTGEIRPCYECVRESEIQSQPCIDIPEAQDPNLKLGPSGLGEGFVSKNDRFKYRIDFENLASATAPAAEVRISDILNPLLRLGSFRLGDIHFGSTTVDVPDGRTSFQTTVDLTASAGVLVEVTAGVNAETNEAFWILRSIDPATGEPPTDGTVGFLPPEDGTGRGQGWVEFSILPRSQAPVGSVIRNEATITFDFEEPIVTNEWVNTLAEAPVELVITTDLPAATVNQAYNGSINVTGGTLPYTFTRIVGAGDLPPGLSLNADGTITGTPTQSGNYSFSVQVADAANHSSVQQASITVAALENELPVANAGQDQTVTLGSGVALNGSASTDPDNGPQPLSYTWQFITVPANSTLQNANLIGANTAQPSFTSDVPGEYRLSLTVSDGVSSGVDKVIVTVISSTPVYLDVPSNYWAYPAIQALAASGVSTGCGGNRFCPQDAVTRAQLALFLERKLRGGNHIPAAPSGTRFSDVPANSFAAAWIEQIAMDGIVGDCGNGRYCPNQVVTRAELAVYLGRLIHGSGFTPAAAQGNVFGDVPANGFAAAWIEQLAADNLTGGCGSGRFCPRKAVTRAELAVLLNRITGITAPAVAPPQTGSPQRSLHQSVPVIPAQGSENTAATTAGPAVAQHLSYADLPLALRQWLEEKNARVADISANADATRIVFSSDAPDLVPADTNGASDVFLYDTLTRELRRLSVSSQGQQANGPSYSPRIDATGQTVVFVSEANNLVESDSNNVADIFIHLLPQGVTERVSRTEWNEQAATAARHPALTAAGDEILYDRADPQGPRQVYRYDRFSTNTEVLSLPDDNQGYALDNHHPGISADGRYVTYLEETLDATGRPLACHVDILDRRDRRFNRQVCPELLTVMTDPVPIFSADGRALQWTSAVTRLEPIADESSTPPVMTVILTNPLQ